MTPLYGIETQEWRVFSALSKDKVKSVSSSTVLQRHVTVGLEAAIIFQLLLQQIHDSYEWELCSNIYVKTDSTLIHIPEFIRCRSPSSQEFDLQVFHSKGLFFVAPDSSLDAASPPRDWPPSASNCSSNSLPDVGILGEKLFPPQLFPGFSFIELV